MGGAPDDTGSTRTRLESELVTCKELEQVEQKEGSGRELHMRLCVFWLSMDTMYTMCVLCSIPHNTFIH